MMYQKGNKIGGFFHQYSGQEPVAVGSIGVLRENDYVITAYRDHGHALARGMSAKAAMAELLGKATGCSKGKGGSMHFFDVEKGFLGGHAIVGSHIPLAAGVAFAIKYRGEDRVCICYFGDGAMNQGSVHEAFNMAALWKLPVIYVVENNMYAMGTSLDAVLGGARPDGARRRALRHSRPLDQRQRHRADGQDDARSGQRARAGEGPDVHRGPDLPLQGPLDQRPGQVPPQGRARIGRQARPDRRLPERPLEGARLDRSGGDRPHARERQGRGRREHRVRRAERATAPGSPLRRHHGRPLTSRRSDHGGAFVPRSLEPGDDRGDGARRERLPDGRGGRASTTAPTRSARGCSSGSARAGSSTRRSPRKGSPASASARRWSGCGRSSSS